MMIAEQFFQIIVDSISQWGYTGIFIGMALESACIPVPSELIFGFAGYLVYLGKLNFILSTAAGVAGGLLGSVIAYLAGFYGGRPFVEKYGKYVLLSKQHIDTAQRWFDRYGLKATFFSRLLPVVRTFISLPAGFAKVDLGKFILYTVLGSLPWTVALLYAGQMLGENWRDLNAMGHEISLVVAAVLVVAVVYYLRKNRTQPN
jgi:membrane protein DedA with SNARE-associated domain